MNLADLDRTYDLVVVGGGVTGAGVFHRAATLGYQVLLVEEKDFAWGTSSRSSKMVHGGLRYLKEGKFLLTRASVRERERLLSTYPGLVLPLNFLMPIFKEHGPSKATMAAGLTLYSLMAGARQHEILDRKRALALVPDLRTQGLSAAVAFRDAQVDDARLVLRLIFDGRQMGGHALNYTRAARIERDSSGQVQALSLIDPETGASREVRTRTIINATGVFAESLHPSPNKGVHIRPLRGSHLVFPGSLLALDRVISYIHPQDNRPVFVFPWQGALVLGTTDVDHSGALAQEPGISPDEARYLIAGARHILPGLDLSLTDAISAIAGVRPVLSRGKKSASRESRDHVVWKDKGLVTVTGGKLTTFSLLARDALKAAASWLPAPDSPVKPRGPESDRPQDLPGDLDLPGHLALSLGGRYGSGLVQLAQILSPRTRHPVGTTQTLWAELVYAAGHEQVRHLSDLLLRRVRIGLLLKEGGMEIMDEIRQILTPHLGWDSGRWDREIEDYQALWQRAHSPGGSLS